MANPINTVVRTVVEYSPARVNGVRTTNTCKQEKYNSLYILLLQTQNVLGYIYTPLSIHGATSIGRERTPVCTVCTTMGPQCYSSV